MKVAIAVIVVLLLAAGLAQYASRAPSYHAVALKQSGGQTSVDFNPEVSYWESRIWQIGAKAAYAELSHSVQTLSPLERHIAAHAFGEALYRDQGIDGLSVCDTQFGQGCFHQLIGDSIAQYGLGSALQDLDQRCAKEPDIPNARSCEHGIGHGLVSYLGYSTADLQQALDICANRIQVTNFTLGCSGGAFMEYNLRLLAQDTSPSSTVRVRTPATMYTPCDQIDEIYRASCFFWQPEWWYATLNGGETASLAPFSAMGDYCRGLPNAADSDACFEGIGYSAPWHNQDAVFTANACAKVSPTANGRLKCWSYAVSQFTPNEAATAAPLVCTGLQSADYDHCIAHDRDEVRLNADIDPLR